MPTSSTKERFAGKGAGHRVLFVTREPILQELGGSTTYALNIIRQLRLAGCEVIMLVTQPQSRSARPWFRIRATLPDGIDYRVPGMVRFAGFYFDLFSAHAWARAIVRLSGRKPFLGPLAGLLRRTYGDALFDGAWDLTAPTAAERALLLDTATSTGADVIVANYAYFAALFSEPALAGRRKVILMHDLLSARVAGLRAAGLPLDCPPIDAATELSWLAQADCLLAAQEREAAVVAPQVTGTVLVPPVIFDVQPLIGKEQPGRIFFVGAGILPNTIGIQWFLEHVWPIIHAQNPAATFALAGTVCGTVEGTYPGVELLGMVPSMADEYARAAVCIAPLLVGSGIKIKVLEALSYGKAVVATSIGVQGLEGWTAGAVDVEDAPEAFAAAVLRVLADDDHRRGLEAGGLMLMRDHFSALAPSARGFLAAVLGTAD